MKRIPIPRPIDPELAALWDEARRSIEARGIADELDAMGESLKQTAREHRDALREFERRPIALTLDDETRPIWECAQRAAAEVAAWPAWKRNELPRDEDCCVGDVTRCRCASGKGQLAMSDADVEREKWMAVWGDEP